MSMIDSIPWTGWVIAIFVVWLTGISKAGFGGALGGVSVPLLALVIPAPQAAALLLPVLYAIDWLGIRVYWKDFSREEMRRLLPGAICGVVIGSLCLGLLDPVWVELAVGVIAVGLGIYRLVPRGGQDQGRAGIGSAWFWSGVSGFTSALAHAGGPPLFAYLSHRQLDGRRFVATASTFFVIVNLLKMPAYIAAGLLQPRLLLVSLILMPIVPIGIRTGVWLQRRLAPQVFQKVFTVILLLTGTELVWSALTR